MIKISLNFVSKDPINNIPALVQIMAWRRQAIIWTNDGKFTDIYMCLNELIPVKGLPL